MPTESQQAPAKSDVDSRQEEERRLHERMEQIGRKLIVLSGKAGVGSVAASSGPSAARRDRPPRRRRRPISGFTKPDNGDCIIFGVISHLNGSWEKTPLKQFTQLC
jgi:hypothetical protein